MRPSWLLLGVSVLCLLVLFPAAVLSHGPSVKAGCGAATVDGVMSPGEWDDATRVRLVGIIRNVVPWSEQWDGAGLEGEVTPAREVSGWLYLMNDGSRYLYVAASMRLDNITADPDWWRSGMRINFTDEPDALDDEFAADGCDPLPAEGWFVGYRLGKGFLATQLDVSFLPRYDVSWCSDGHTAVGVIADAGPATTLVWEWRIDLRLSELDKIAPPDCFRFGTNINAYVCTEGPDCADVEWRFWPVYWLIWPEDNWDGNWPGEFGTLCLNRCAEEPTATTVPTPQHEEEFVPEHSAILLLGSGLAGLAGYATLRWRTRE